MIEEDPRTWNERQIKAFSSLWWLCLWL